MSSADANPTPPTLPRWRRVLSHPLIPVALLVIAAVLLAKVWADDERAMRQQKNIQSVTFAGMALIASFMWFIALSRVAWVIRMRVLAAVAGLAVAGFVTLKIEGVDGDLVPIVRWRWSKTPDRALGAVEVAPRDLNGDVIPNIKWRWERQPDGKLVQVEVKPAAENGTSNTTKPPASPTSAGDFPRFLGPHRDGHIDSVKLNRDWSAHPPKEIWRRPIGAGWSGFAVVGHQAITQEQRGDDELVVCYDLLTGTPLWSHADKARYDTTIAGVGPRATPTVAGDRVYTMGGTGILNCLERATGKRLWSADTVVDAGGEVSQWGVAGSPLVDGDRVIVPTSGAKAMAAYACDGGKRLWAVGPGPTSYASPCVLELFGQRQLVMQNQMTITGHALDDGRVLWSHATPGGHPKVAQPLPLGGDRLLVSSGYGTGSEAFQLTKAESGEITTRSLWKNVYLKSKFANMVLRDGHIYGFNDGTLTCLVADSGERAWRGERYGHGQLLLVGDVLLIQAESGEVVLVEATEKDFRELSRFTALTDKTWNSPTLAGKYLLVRNDREAACFEVAVGD